MFDLIQQCREIEWESYHYSKLRTPFCTFHGTYFVEFTFPSHQTAHIIYSFTIASYPEEYHFDLFLKSTSLSGYPEEEEEIRQFALWFKESMLMTPSARIRKYLQIPTFNLNKDFSIR